MRVRPDRRYGTRRWKRVRLRVLHRDLWACYVPDCPVSASVADHITPVYPEMPNDLFFDETNLRGSCKCHNTARGVAARLERELDGRGPTTQSAGHADAQGSEAVLMTRRSRPLVRSETGFVWRYPFPWHKHHEASHGNWSVIGDMSLTPGPPLESCAAAGCPHR